MAVTAQKHHVENAYESQADGSKAPVKTTQTVRERRLRGSRDEFYVSPAKRKEYGVKDDEKLAWVRNSAGFWKDKETGDRIAQMQSPLEHGGKEARLVSTGEFDRVELGDLVLMAIPGDVAADDQAIIDEGRNAFEEGLRADTEYNKHSVRSHQELHVSDLNARFNPGDSEYIAAMARAESDYNHKSGLIGGPTANMSLLQAERFMKGKEAEVEHRQELLRMGAAHTGMDAGDFQKMMYGGEKALAQMFGEAESKRLFGMGEHGLGKSNAQRLAERGKGRA